MEISFALGELLFAGVWFGLRALVCLSKGRVDWKREGMLLLMYVNLAVILRFTFFPFSCADGRVRPLLFDPAAFWPLRINLIPFVHILEYGTKRELLVNILGNVGMYIPSGIVLPVLWKRLDSFWKVTAAGAAISLCAELLQLPFSARATDIDDLILNTLGVMIGYGIYAIFRKKREKPDSMERQTGS